MLLLENKSKQSNTVVEDSEFKVMDRRKTCTPDWPDLDEYEYVFLPTGLGKHLKQLKLFCKDYKNLVTLSRIYYMGQGCTQFNTYCIRENPASPVDQYFMREFDNTRKSSVIGEVFALDKFQLNVLDQYYHYYMNTKRCKTAIQFLDQRFKHHMKLVPIQLVWAYVSDPKEIIDSHLFPYPSRTIHNKVKEFVYMV